MIQKNEALTRDDNCISLICTRRAAVQEDCLATTETEIPVSTGEQTWIFEVGEKVPVNRTTPRLVNILVKISKRLNRLGSAKIDDGLLEARHNIHHNLRING